MTDRDPDHSALSARRRALCSLGLFALGILLGAQPAIRETPSSTLIVLGCAGLVLCAAVLGTRRMRSVLLGFCVLLLGMGWVLLRTDTDRPDRVGTLVGELDPRMNRVPIEVRGMISESSRVVQRVPGLADPPMWPAASNRAMVEVEAVLVHESASRSVWLPASGSLRLMLPEAASVFAGERVEMLGKFAPVLQRSNPGDPDWAALSAQQGLAGTLVIEHAAHIRVLAHANLWGRLVGGLRSVRSIIRTRALEAVGLSEPASGSMSGSAPGAMRAALLLGERDPVLDEVFEKFQRVGVAHVLAISGFHLALVVLMIVVLIRLLGEHPRLETSAVVAVLIGVAVLIPMRPPIVRAAVIVGAMVIATRFGRRYDRMTILAWVGLGLLVWRPLDAMAMGYQLSMGITALLVLLAQRRKQTLLNLHRGVGGSALVRSRGARGLLRRGGTWLGEALRVNFACWLVALPCVMYHAGVMTLLAPIAAVVLIPLVALLMALGYLQMLAGIVAPELALSTRWMIEHPTLWILESVTWFEGLGFAWMRVPALSVWWAMMGTMVGAALVTGRVRWYRPGGLALIALVVGWGVLEPTIRRADVPVRVVMLDVGDGTCVVVQSGDQALLWDCGSLDRRVGQSTARSLRALGVRRLIGVIVTHDNLDHFNGLVDLGNEMELGRVWITTRLRDDPSPAFARVYRALVSKGIEIGILGQDQQITLGRADIRVLWPDPNAIDGFDDNDTSAVALIRVTDQTQSAGVLLTGDIEGPAMERLMIAYPDLPAMLNGGGIELPHHGSARERAYGFVEWLNPSIVLQSTGPSRLDDPRWDAQRTDRNWYTTASQGALWLRIESDGSMTHGSWTRQKKR